MGWKRRAFMTLSRRSFISGLAGLLSLLVWPWKAKATPPPGEFFQGRLIINENPLGESPSVRALEDIRNLWPPEDMLTSMLKARDELWDAQPKTHWLTIPERNVEMWEKHFPGEMIQVTRKIT
jgi:hypothetical protein